MSIQTELTRLTNAKAAIKTAIEGKGVTVPDGTLLDGMASLIESIEAGGGFENIQTVTGSFTPESLIGTPTQQLPSINAFTVEHNAGFVPRAAIAYTGTYGASKLTIYAAIVEGVYGVEGGYTVSTYSVHQYYSNKKYINDDIIRTSVSTWSDSVFTIAHSQSSIQLSSGTTVNWVVFS